MSCLCQNTVIHSRCANLKRPGSRHNLPAPAEDLVVARKVVSDCFMSLRKRQGNAAGRDLDRALTQCQDEEQMFALLRQKMELKKRLMQEQGPQSKGVFTACK